MHGDPNDLNQSAYKRRLVFKKRSKDTISSYLWWMTDLAKWVDGRDITTVDVGDVEDYFIHRFTDMKDNSAGVAFRSLRAFFNWAVSEEIIDVSPMAKLEEPAAEDTLQQIATDEHIAALIKACAGRTFEDRRDTAMIRLFLEAGTPRRAEMAGILLERVDLRTNKIELLGKGNKWRTIIFGVNTGIALDRYLRMRTRHQLAGLPELWLGSRGKPLTDSGIRQMLVRRCKQAGIPLIKPHQLRHTTYHHWRDQGGSIDDAEALWGWEDGSKMTRHYGKSVRLTRAERAARKMTLGDRI